MSSLQAAIKKYQDNKFCIFRGWGEGELIDCSDDVDEIHNQIHKYFCFLSGKDYVFERRMPGQKLLVYLVLDRHSNKLRVQGGHVCPCVCDLVSQPKAFDIVLKCDMTLTKRCVLPLLVKLDYMFSSNYKVAQ